MCIQVPRLNIINRAFAISQDKNIAGSCFAIPINGVAYLIAAAHVIRSMEERVQNELFIFQNDQWVNIIVTPYFISRHSFIDNDIDIAIIETTIKLQTNDQDIQLSADGLILGQDVYFLGFPYIGSSLRYQPEKINHGFPLPFIKKATLSKTEDRLFYLDGHNNPGFSGGPIIFWNYETSKHQVLGVISRYIPQFGKVASVEDSRDLLYHENSGIAIGYSIEFVIEFLKEEGLR